MPGMVSEGSVFVSEVIKERNTQKKKKKRHRDKRGVHFVEEIIEKKEENRFSLQRVVHTINNPLFSPCPGVNK